MRDAALALLRELVAIDSVNPDLVPGGAGEAAVAAHIGSWAIACGLRVEVVEVEPGRPNVIVTAPGTGGGRSLMLNAHTDVVGTAGYVAPFEPAARDGRLFGRGVLDTKVGVATALIIAREAMTARLRGDVIVACVVDEECGSKGTEALIASGPR
ncbi:MAG TPA: M20/M25/M40 family metallo-hydrolase, partial [Ilumatobacteraceae bacterium]